MDLHLGCKEREQRMDYWARRSVCKIVHRISRPMLGFSFFRFHDRERVAGPSGRLKVSGPAASLHDI